MTKNNCRVFERLFKRQKNGVFLFGLSFRISMYQCIVLCKLGKYGNDIMPTATKMVKYWGNIEAVFLKLGKY